MNFKKYITNHKRRSSVNFGGQEKTHLPENKMPEFYMIFARKLTKFQLLIVLWWRIRLTHLKLIWTCSALFWSLHDFVYDYSLYRAYPLFTSRSTSFRTIEVIWGNIISIVFTNSRKKRLFKPAYELRWSPLTWLESLRPDLRYGG